MTRVLGTMIVLAALASAGCAGGLASPSEFTPESFTGTLAVGGTAFHSFTVRKNGELNITVRQVLPTVTFGLALGQVSGGQCQFSTAGALFVTQGSQYTNALTPGAYCVALFDVGVLPASVTYTIVVTHS